MTDTSLAIRGNGTVMVTPEQTALVKQTIAKDATDAELALFFYDCQRRGTHPLDKLIHFTKRGGKYTPVTSIDFMRARAAESGDYAGNDDAEFGPEDGKGQPTAARVTVYRMVQGQRVPFTATARWSEYYPGDQSGMMWRKMPHTMLAKCAEALALRKGFPQQLSGLYTVEEMDQATGEVSAPRPAPKPAPRPPQKPVEAVVVVEGTGGADAAYELDGEPPEAIPEPVAPPKAKPAPKQAPAEAKPLPDDAYVLCDVITKMSKKETKKPGNFRYGFLLGGLKKWVNTFDSTLAQQAEIAIELKTPMVLTVRDGQYGTDVIDMVEDTREVM